jgi:ElaB/YqjD/DUF883 family membrane-anchored ribosome-binding protein
MESRGRDLSEGAQEFGREAAELGQEKAEEWSESAKHLSQAAMDKAQATYHLAQDKTAACLRVTDQAVRTNPYTFLGVALGIGILIGVLARRE